METYIGPHFLKGNGVFYSTLLVSLEELLMSQVVQQEALGRLLVEKGIFTKEKLLERVSEVNQEMKTKR